MKDNIKEVLKIVVVGHVDHGKSTVIGKLLYDTNSLPEGTVNKVKKIAKDTGKPFEYAYLLDAFEEEQEQGITIDTTQIQFNTDKREYVIIDAPGHKEFLKNMISGAADAEAALLIVDGKQGVQEQSKRHAYILSLLGIKKVHVIVNKMDLVEYSKEVFEKVKDDMNKFLSNLNVYPLSYIPVSAFLGENIVVKSDKLNWYEGKTLIDSIDSIEKDKGIEDKELRFPIQDIYKFDDRRIIAGRIESGKLKVGDEINIYPEGKKTKIKTIEYWTDKDKKDEVYAGESIGITVEDEFFNKRGEIIATEKIKPIISNRFRANIFWMGKSNFVKNKKYKIKLTTTDIEGELDEIIRVIDASSLNSNDENKNIVLNDVAEVIIKVNDLIAFDIFSNNHSTGRFVIVDEYDVAGGGIITNDEYIEEKAITSGFKYNDLIATGDIFEEYYYEILDNSLRKKLINKKVYIIGDIVPLEGKSFKYPSSLDILAFRDRVAIKIRDGKVNDIIQLEEYKYNEVPVVNGRGFAIKVKSNKDIEELFKSYTIIKERGIKEEEEFFNNWIIIDKYRSLAFNAEFI